MEARRSDLLLSPVFLLALGTLLANDLWLKQAFPGLVTGKLSDVSGLFAIVVFARVLFPRRAISIGVLFAAAFAFWKSPLADPLCTLWNLHLPWAIGRVKDPTDLLALAVIPLAVTFSQGVRRRSTRRGRVMAISAVAVFAFVNTSTIPEHWVFEPPAEPHVRSLPLPTDEVRSELERCFEWAPPPRFYWPPDEREVVSFAVRFRDWLRRRTVAVSAELHEEGAGTRLVVARIDNLGGYTNLSHDEIRERVVEGLDRCFGADG